MSLDALQEALGHRFADLGLLREALTHPSTHAQGKNPGADNERLEFLGDAVLQLAVTERLYEMFPGAPEGRLTIWRAELVSRARMAQCGERLGLGPLLEMSFGEARNAGRTRTSNLANAVEAVLGAVHRDGGWEAARRAVARLLEAEFAALTERAAAPEAETVNAKGALQERLQADGGEAPRYVCLTEEGPAHARRYEVAVYRGEAELGRGVGKSKREAEMNAARAALQRGA